MTTSRQQILLCLTKLQHAGFRLPKTVESKGGLELAVEMWLGLLGNYHPSSVIRTFDGWIKVGDGWPLPKDILPRVDAEQARLERRLAPPRDQGMQAELNASLNAAMGWLSGALLVAVDVLGREDPAAKARWVLAMAEWAHGSLPPPPWPGDYRPPIDDLHRAARRLLPEAA